jgi:flagellar biosynthesis regulator FlaF
MSNIDFSKPVTLEEAVEALSFALQRVMVSLRDHVAFDDTEIAKTLRAAIFVSSMMEDNKTEIEGMITLLEKREVFG